MGQSVTKAFDNLKGHQEHRILMVGLDAAGKTTVLYRLKLSGAVDGTIPTIGYNVETVKYRNIDFTVWDVGGQDKIRPLWRHYLPNTQGLIFVVDSAEDARFPEAKRELQALLQEDDLKGASVLILGNKQDLPNAKTVAELSDALGVTEFPAHIHWHIQMCCASTGDGLYDGLDWLSKDIGKRKREELAAAT